MEPYYIDESCVIFLGKMQDILPGLGDFDLLLTDPPYGLSGFVDKRTLQRKQHLSRSNLAKGTDYGDVDWDERCPELVSLAIQKAKHQIIWGGNYYTDILPPSSSWIIWDKNNGESSFADCELAWTSHKQAARKFTWKWQGMIQQWGGHKKEARKHPTQKPLRLMGFCIENYGCDTIIDPFMGVFCVGIEREEKYCKVAIERLQQEVLSF